jgi:hypothetical protein
VVDAPAAPPVADEPAVADDVGVPVVVVVVLVATEPAVAVPVPALPGLVGRVAIEPPAPTFPPGVDAVSFEHAANTSAAPRLQKNVRAIASSKAT